MLKERLDQDLKKALLAGNEREAMVLRSIKSAIIYAEVAAGVKGTGGLPEDAIMKVLAKEAKKRQESADIFNQGGRTDRADTELQEKAIIEKYLPAALSTEEIQKLVNTAVEAAGGVTPQTMGKIISQVKEMSHGTADGATVAQLVKDRMQRW